MEPEHRAPTGARAPNGLTDDERRLLEFERGHPGNTPRKESLIVETFDVSPTRYYQRLDVVFRTSAALELDPLLVRRLRERSARRLRERLG